MSGSTTRLLAGTVSFTINDETWNAVDGVEYRPSTVERVTLKGQSAVEGYSEVPREGMISGNLRNRSDKTVQSLNALGDADITVQAANGTTVLGIGMWQVGDIKVTTREGTFNVQFESDNVVEQLP
jgi:hypothetical protein